MTDTSKTKSVMPTVPVWDVFVRIFHWALVGSVGTALATGLFLLPSALELHIASAIVAAVLVFLRIVWGFTGTGYARFRSFVFSPAAIAAHSLSLMKGTSKRFIGHNPLGGTMILALIAVIAVLTVTGTLVLGGMFKTGPLAFGIDYSFGNQALELHEVLAYLLSALIAAHVGGVIFETLHNKDPLVPAMFSGRKPSRDEDVIAPPRRALRGTMIVVSTIGLALTWTAVNVGTRQPIPNMPVSQIDTLVEDECTACHILFHPSLMPAEKWDRMMLGLDDHFGEDASLDPQDTAEIRDWLMDHAAGNVDTRAAHVLAFGMKDSELSLSGSESWRLIHEDLNDSVFENPKVRSKSNCSACHRDAEEGLFNPLNLKLPK